MVITRRVEFSASHVCRIPRLSDEENGRLFGPEANPHGHGHNYVIQVLVGGPVDSETGMVINMLDLDQSVQNEVLARFDHTNLNLDPLFVNRVPTTENLCRAVYELLDGKLTPANLVQVRIEETENNFFEYSGESR